MKFSDPIPKFKFSLIVLACALFNFSLPAHAESKNTGATANQMNSKTTPNSSTPSFSPDELLEKLQILLEIPEGRITKAKAEQILKLSFQDERTSSLPKRNSEILSYSLVDPKYYSISGYETESEATRFAISLKRNIDTPPALCIDREKMMATLRQAGWETKGMTGGLHGDPSNSYWYMKGISGLVRVDFGPASTDVFGGPMCLSVFIISNSRP